MKTIWYLLDCLGQEERTIVERCRKTISGDIVETAWIVKCQKLLRYQGEWHIAERNLFPGYVMLSVPSREKSEDLPEKILKELLPGQKRNGKDVNQTSILSVVDECRKENLMRLCAGSMMVKLSKGRIYNKDIIVTKGPLAGYEKNICKIDRHKRVAWVEVPGEQEAKIFPRICVGFEVYEKLS